MDTTISRPERVIIIGLDNDQPDYQYSMTELTELAEANQMEVVDRLDQALDRPNAATYFGSGKVEELAQLVAALEVPTVIANDELSPSQLQNLTKATGVRVIDRTALILEIFACPGCRPPVINGSTNRPGPVGAVALPTGGPGKPSSK